MSAIQHAKNLKRNRAKAKKLEKQISHLKKELECVHKHISIGEQVSRIYKGVPIQETSLGFSSVGPGTPRDATIYRNAIEPKFWGLRVYGDGRMDEWIRLMDEWVGAGYTRKEVLFIAKEWVAFGVLPDDEDRKYWPPKASGRSSTVSPNRKEKKS
jgi:hypothetical protein